jgi:hypothetical protein
MASLSAQLIVPSRPWRMTRIQTRISHVHPTANIHQRGKLLLLGDCGVLRACAPPAMLWHTRVPATRSEATVERWMGAARTTRRSRRSGPAEDRAQPAEGRRRRTGGGSWPTTSIWNAGGAFTNRMTAETLGVRADIACVICLTARQELSRQRVGLASPDNSDTHDSNAGRGPASTRPQGCASARPARTA